MSLKKHIHLSQGDKLKVIAAHEAGVSRTELLREYKLGISSFYRIMREKESIVQQCLLGKSNLRRHRGVTFPDIERCVLEWINQRFDHDLPIDGPLLQAQAKLFAIKLGIDGFSASNGWLSLFKKRHALSFNKSQKELSDDVADKEMHADWNACFTSTLSECDANDLYCVAETGLFYNCLPEQISSYRDMDCRNGEHRQERVSVLLGCNVTGTNKLPILVVGQLNQTKCRKELTPQDNYMYKSNWNAWITRDIFQEWLMKVDQLMMEAERYIVLLVNHSPVHAVLPNMTNTKVVFYFTKPEEMYEKHHLLLHTFKRNFRTDSIAHLLEMRDQGIEPNISIPSAVRIAVEAWDNISSNTIVNCYMDPLCGSDEMYESSQEQNETKDVIWPHEADKLLLAQEMLEIPSFSDYIRVDQRVVVAGMVPDDKIVEMVMHPDDQVEGAMEDDTSTDNEKHDKVSTTTTITGGKQKRPSTTVQKNRPQSQDIKMVDMEGTIKAESIVHQSIIRKEDALDAVKKLRNFFSQRNQMDVTFNVLYELETFVRNVKD